jgi:hypothetical protein
MAAIKKSVRIVDGTIRLCHELTLTGDTNFSGSINSMAQQYKMFVTECLPVLTDNEKNALYSVHNGYTPHPDIEQEVALLHWHISEGYQYDQSVAGFLGSKVQATKFIERIKGWSKPEKLAVIYMARAYWRQGQIAGLEND